MDGEQQTCSHQKTGSAGVCEGYSCSSNLTEADVMEDPHCPPSPEHTAMKGMDSNVDSSMVMHTDTLCVDIPNRGLDNNDTQIDEEKHDISLLTDNPGSEAVEMSQSIEQVEPDNIRSLQNKISCRSDRETESCRLSDSTEGRDCDLEIMSSSKTSEHLHLSDTSILHDESVVEFSREKFDKTIECRPMRVEHNLRGCEEQKTRPVVDRKGDVNPVEENSTKNQKTQKYVSRSDYNLIGNDSDNTEVYTRQACVSDVKMMESGCDAARMESCSGSGSHSGERLHSACVSDSASSLNTSSSPENDDGSDSNGVKNSSSSLDRTDSCESGEGGGRYSVGMSYRDPGSSALLLSELETLVRTEAAPASPHNADFDITTLDFSSTPKHNLMKMLSGLLDECDALKKDKARLEGEVDRLEADKSSEVYTSQIEGLEKSLAQARADACSWKGKVCEAEQRHTAEVVRVREDLTGRLERITLQYQAANKDKEAMVIKYATSECEVILARKQKESVERKVRELEKEREQLQAKNKMLISERARICQTLDTKVQRINWYQREVERLKEEVNSREVKIKWAQTKLKAEMDAYQDCQGKLDRALTMIVHHEEEMREVRERAEGVVKAAVDDQNSRANVLNMQLKEEKARVILERQVNEDRGSAFSRVSTELNALRMKHSALEEESVALRTRVVSLESEREESEKLFGSLRTEVTSARQESSQLSLQLANSSHLQYQLDRERELVASIGQEVEQLQATQMELEAELDACRAKEAELLAFTQKLSNKNVEIQSQFSALQSKNQLVEVERDEAVSELEEVRQQRTQLKTDLARERHTHAAQVGELRRAVVEKSEETQQLSTRVMDLESEIQVLNRKHTNALKDIMREMHKLRRRVEQQEDGGCGEGVGVGMGMGGNSGRSSQVATPHDTISQGSPASSNTSLNTLEYNHPTHNGTHHQEGMLEPVVSQQVLVERIVRLQRAAARRAEKIEFLEEHVAQLLTELKKKSRIIHHYIMKEEAGALISSASDSSKAEVLRHGGIMASVYGSSPRDSTMTLDLSLEINTKLQAVLEDTLLKNITLKENLNTLGDEIAKISHQNQQLRSQK